MTTGDSEKFDAIVIGAGPNGLTCANYLMRAGKKVLVVEKRFEVGGSLITEDFGGARYDLHSSTMPLAAEEMPPIGELSLADQGFSQVQPAACAAIHTSHSTLILAKDSDGIVKPVSKLSAKDDRALGRLARDLKSFHNGFLLQWLYNPPAKSGFEKLQAILGDTPKLSPLQILEESYVFESEELKALLLYLGGMLGVVPDEPNSGFQFFLFLDSMLNSSTVRGGAFMLAYSLYKPLISGGCQVWEGRTVSKIIVEEDKAAGVILDDGRKIHSSVTVSTVDIPTTFGKMLGEGIATQSMVDIAKSWKWDPWSLFQAHWTVKGAMPFKDPAEWNALLHLVGYENSDDVVKHFKLVSNGETMEAGCFALPSQFDGSLAPRGSQVVKFETIAPYSLSKGDWETTKDSYSKRCLTRFTSAIGGLAEERVTWEYAYPPTYIQMKLANCFRGSINGGACIESQPGSVGSSEKYSSYKTPIKGLYVCGAGVHPGGMVTLAGGYNCASQIELDFSSLTEKSITT